MSSFQLTNYADSGYVGAWAWDTVNRHLRIWKQAGGVFCAQISDDGSKFVTIGGYSPAGGGNLNAGVTGTFTGGYIIAGINGRFDPHYKKSGDLGSFDAKCDTQFTCKRRLSVLDQLLQRREVGRVLGLGLAVRRRHVGQVARPGEHLAPARRRHPQLEERRSRPVARPRPACARRHGGPGRAAPGRARRRTARSRAGGTSRSRRRAAPDPPTGRSRLRPARRSTARISSSNHSPVNRIARSRTGPGWVSISAATEAKKQPPGIDVALHVLEEALHERPEPPEPRRLRQRRGDDELVVDVTCDLDRRELKLLLRAEVGEEPALAHPDRRRRDARSRCRRAPRRSRAGPPRGGSRSGSSRRRARRLRGGTVGGGGGCLGHLALQVSTTVRTYDRTNDRTN